jgi:hypothetical protein
VRQRVEMASSAIVTLAKCDRQETADQHSMASKGRARRHDLLEPAIRNAAS